ncbi:cupin domain-containing protein [Kribbella kalugense]|uniref:Cupin domain n=1 Tax=Kribbella kalugense TaxID=2512221 RepID=A0A4R7ZMK5_9ACTN|nr:cupin domain-containing protein [Kribbella kalugense]TDW18506.1 cupin domain [Kribbella kalugense]
MCDFESGPALALPGGIGISRLTVYDVEAPDGLVGGTPHVHLACSEGYYVVGGTGSVQTLNTKGYTETPLQAGTVVWFEPGTIHRLVNDGELQILTLMSNSGLPEAGDAVLTLPPEHLADRETYLQATALSGEGEALTASAIARRDLALQGYDVLRERYESEGPAALEDFFAAAIRIVQPQLADWRRRWEQGARRLADETGAALDALEAGIAPHLESAELHQLPVPTEFGRHGMCGRLDVYDTNA